MDLVDDNAARITALDALPDMARDVLPDGDERLLSVSVRNAHGGVIYHATLTLAGGWQPGHNDNPPSPPTEAKA